MCLMRPSCLEEYPKLKAWYEAILAEPATQAVLEGRSPIGELKQYMVTQEQWAEINKGL